MNSKLLRIGSIVIFFLAIIFFIVAGPAADYFLGKNISSGVFGTYKNSEIGFTNDDFNSIYAKLRAGNEQADQAEQNDARDLYQAYNLTISALNADANAKDAGYVPSSDVIKSAISKLFTANSFFSKEVYENRYPNTPAATRNQICQEERNKLYNNVYNFLLGLRYVRDVFGSNDGNQLNGLVLRLSGEQASSGVSYAQIIQQFVMSDLIQNMETLPYGTKSSPAEAKFLSEFGTEKHSFDMVAFETTSLPKEECTAYLNENKNLFTKYDLSVVSFDKKSEAEAAVKAIKAGEKSFDDVFLSTGIRYYSGSQGKSQVSYRFQLDDLVKNESAVNKIAALAKDEYSEPVKTDDVYSVFRCDGDKKEADAADEAVMNVVSSYISANESAKIKEYWTAKASEFVEKAKGKGFDAACKELKLTKVSVPAFPLNYNDSPLADKMPSDIYQLTRASRDENILKTMFSLKEVGALSEPVEYGHNIIVLGLTGIQKGNPQTTESVKTNTSNFDMYSSLLNVIRSDSVKDNFFETYSKLPRNN